jgi:hypothetical protein
MIEKDNTHKIIQRPVSLENTELKIQKQQTQDIYRQKQTKQPKYHPCETKMRRKWNREK